jgi:hypothetical protein
VAEDVIQSKRIELVDDQGEPVVVLTTESGENGELAGLVVTGVQEGAPFATIGLDREENRPYLYLGFGDATPLATISFAGDRAFLQLRNADGTEQTFTPRAEPVDDSDMGYVPGQDILPIFTADLSGEDPIFHSHEGTGFLVGKNVIVTCWHCVRADLPEGWAYLALRKDHSGDTEWFKMVNIEQDHNGTDLATAWVNADPEMQLKVAEEPALMSEEIWSYGYPLTDVSQHPELGYKRFRPNPRWMQTYILRDFVFPQPGFGDTPSYELDMPALEGMSGAPIGKAHSREVIGVLYGRNDAEQIEVFSSKDPETGRRTPEQVRTTYFAVAHYTETLKNLRGTATKGQPLADFLKS